MKKFIKENGLDRSKKEIVIRQSLFRISGRLVEIMQSESENIHKIFGKDFAESPVEHYRIFVESVRLVYEFDEVYKQFIEFHGHSSVAMEVSRELLNRLIRHIDTDIGSVKLLIHALEELFYSNPPQIEQ